MGDAVTFMAIPNLVIITGFKADIVKNGLGMVILWQSVTLESGVTEGQAQC